jgi:hypothetical protein
MACGNKATVYRWGEFQQAGIQRNLPARGPAQRRESEPPQEPRNDMFSLLELAQRHLFRRTLFISALLLLALTQWTCLREKVLYVDPKVYASEATELKVTSRWRLGYAVTYHGARLVRTPKTVLSTNQHDSESGVRPR